MMVASLLLEVDFLRWEGWLTIVAGVGFAGLAFAVGRMTSRRSAVDEDDKDGVVEDYPDPTYDPFVHGSTQEQRKAVRRKGGQVEILLSDESAKERPWHGWVLDRSTGGLGLAVERPICPGTVVTVRTVNAPKVVPWLEMEVKSCREGKEGWEIGCKFVRTPPHGLLLMFG